MRVDVFELNHFHTPNFVMYPEYLSGISGEAVAVHFHALAEQALELEANKQVKNLHAIGGARLNFFLRHLQLFKFFKILYVRFIMAMKKPDLVIFNSIDQPYIDKLFHSLKVKKIGVVHGVYQYAFPEDSDAKYVCMNRYIFNQLKEEEPLDGYFQCFFKPVIPNPKQRDGKLYIGIQGMINYNRRDYPLLIKLARRLKEQQRQDICFDIIGSSKIKHGKKFIQEVEAEGLEEYFIFHDSLNDEAFFDELATLDYLMPLVGKEHERYLYGINSGTYSRSAAYAVPLILSEKNRQMWEIDADCCVAYEEGEDLLKIIDTLKKPSQELIGRYEAFVAGRIEENRIFVKEMIRDMYEKTKGLQ